MWKKGGPDVYMNIPSFIIVSADGIYFDKILVSEYKLFKRSNKANLFRNEMSKYLDLLVSHLWNNLQLVEGGAYNEYNYLVEIKDDKGR